MLGSGAALLVAGVVVLTVLPLSRPLAVAGSVAWIFRVSRELAALWRVYGRLVGYRLFAGGDITVYTDAGPGLDGRVAPGTLVTRRWAWLRVVTSDGRAWAELVAGDAAGSQQWRRFQVIFRHLPAC
ncbi:MAG: hypothetical protein R3358_00735 [Woeseiaceae bacterium]|nr:hypothetical protein [Woeseiaceae bacterium]